MFTNDYTENGMWWPPDALSRIHNISASKRKDDHRTIPGGFLATPDSAKEAACFAAEQQENGQRESTLKDPQYHLDAQYRHPQ